MSEIWTLPPHFQTQFDDSWHEIMAQQTEHRLAGTYTTDTIVGKDKRFDQFGSATSTMRLRTARAAPSLPTDIATAFRWVRLNPYDETTWYDELDPQALGRLPSPDGPAVRHHAIVANRNKDIVLINQMVGTNYTGSAGTTATTFDLTNQLVGVAFGNNGVNCGLTLKKLTQAAYILDVNEVVDEERYFGYSAKELNNLLTNVDQVANYLYNDVRALRDAKVRDFAGFTFKRTELFPVASSVRSCVAWQKKYLLMATGEDIKTRIDILPTHSHAIQIRTTMLLDAMRWEEKGFVMINCDESA